MKFKYYRQYDKMDCGPTCLKMVARHYGRDFSLEFLREFSFITREGVSLYGISEAAQRTGFNTLMLKANCDDLMENVPLPCILHWNQEHFVVLYDAFKKRGRDYFLVADPTHGKVKLTRTELIKSWCREDGEKGILLALEPTELFQTIEEPEQPRPKGFFFLFNYLKPYKWYLFQLVLAMLAASLFSLIFPFLTQNLVDQGINKKNINIIYLILLSQLLLFLGGTAIDMIRNWILLHINTRISISIVSDFLIKLMKLPIRFFDSKMVGDITQRINDHSRIEYFLTSSSLSILFSMINLIIFSVILYIFSPLIFGIFAVGSGLAITWILLFLARRRRLDYLRFQQMSSNNSNLYELIVSMQEVKLNGSEDYKRMEWERIQAKIFNINVKGMALEQYQQFGTIFFGQLRNILISAVAAGQVVEGHITLGMMLSASYIIGQLNSPVEQLIRFFQVAQDARISMDRMGEVLNKADEEKPEHQSLQLLPKQGSIQLENLSFSYGGPLSPRVLDEVNLEIPEGKVTALVGASGSGKTTLLKLLLHFYEPGKGNIRVGGQPLSNISPMQWRACCGTVMQDGILFSDTIARNIAVDGSEIDEERLVEAARMANIYDFIQSLPLGFASKVGREGGNLSTGQKQRILIARAIYKNPKYLFFDEATSALDANNESEIVYNLNRFFEGKTVLIIAHRLSTVKHADNIIVLDKGRIVESGTHQELSLRQGYYYNLVKNQLELGE